MPVIQKETIPRQQIIRYAGNKSRLLERILPYLKKELKPGETFFDLFAGTHAMGYALKQRNKIFANDIQKYSWTIGKALIEGDESITIKSAQQEILPQISKNSGEYTLFEKKFAGTYFAPNQCKEIDDIRFAIDKANISEYKRCGYLCNLMYAMSNLASTTGYFAQYLPAGDVSHLRRKSIKKRFLERCNTFNVIKGKFKNQCFDKDYTEFFNNSELQEYLKASDVIYADPPYSLAQYSRYYHVLETLIKYDYPEIEFKGRYRKDRYKSGFCQVKKVRGEFEALFSGIASFNKTLVLSYVNSGSGLLAEKEVRELAESHFSGVSTTIKMNYNHSSLGNGKPKKVEEFILICK